MLYFVMRAISYCVYKYVNCMYTLAYRKLGLEEPENKTIKEALKDSPSRDDGRGRCRGATLRPEETLQHVLVLRLRGARVFDPGY